MESIAIQDIESELKITLTEHQKKYFNNKQLDKYLPPSTNLQISGLLTRLNKPQVYFRLCQLICKFKQTWDFANFTNMLLKNKKKGDIDFYEMIFKDMKNAQSVTEYSKEYVAEYLYKILDNLNISKPKSLLDIGCGNCILTRDLGRVLGIDMSNVYGADIPEEFEQKWKETRPAEIQFIEIKNNELQFDRKFDLITCMMVLHHVPSEFIKKYIKDIHELLTPKGLFTIKEHDCFNAVDYMIADIEHSLYISKEEMAAQAHKNPNNRDLKLTDELKGKIASQHITYRDRFTWRVLIQRAGFSCIYEEPYDIGLSNTYAPNRAYLAIFQKDT